MPRFTRASDLNKHLKKALDSLQAETLTKTQAELGSKTVSPRETGRLRSSWFAAEGSASSEVAPEGTDRANTDAKSLRVDSSKQYHLTNSLPYVQRVALEGHVVDKGTNWFRDFVDSRIPTIQDEAAKVVKETFDL